MPPCYVAAHPTPQGTSGPSADHPADLDQPGALPTEARKDLRLRSGARAVLAAGITHPLAWLVGLVVWPTNLDVRASDATVLSTYAGSAAPAAVQASLVHGVAGIALAVVTIGLARTARVASAGRTARLILGAGLAAAATSLIQWALDLRLALAVAPSGDAGSAGAVLTGIDRLDGVKMLLLAGSALGGLLLGRWTAARWLTAVSAALALTIAISGIGYLVLIPPLASLAFVSGPLLLIWVPTVAVVAWHAARHHSSRLDH